MPPHVKPLRLSAAGLSCLAVAVAQTPAPPAAATAPAPLAELAELDEFVAQGQATAVYRAAAGQGGRTV